MDEKYIQDLYNQLGGQSKFGNFNDFKNLIKTDKQYQKDFHNSFGAKKLGDFNDFSGLVSSSNQKKKRVFSAYFSRRSVGVKCTTEEATYFCGYRSTAKSTGFGYFRWRT